MIFFYNKSNHCPIENSWEHPQCEDVKRVVDDSATTRNSSVDLIQQIWDLFSKQERCIQSLSCSLLLNQSLVLHQQIYHYQWREEGEVINFAISKHPLSTKEYVKDMWQGGEVPKLNPNLGMKPITQLLHTLHREAQIYKLLANCSLSIIRSSKPIQQPWRVKKFSLKHLKGFMPKVALMIMIFMIFLRKNVSNHLYYKLRNSTITFQVMKLINAHISS